MCVRYLFYWVGWAFSIWQIKHQYHLSPYLSYIGSQGPENCCFNSWASSIHKSDNNNSVLSAYWRPSPVLRSELPRDGLSGPSNQPYFLNPKTHLSDDVTRNSFSPLTPTKRKAVLQSTKYLSIGAIPESKNYVLPPLEDTEASGTPRLWDRAPHHLTVFLLRLTWHHVIW